MKSEIEIMSRVLSGPVPAKARLFGMPVLMHPQLSNSAFPSTPVLPFFSNVFKELGQALGGSDGQQSYTILDRIVSPSFIGSILCEGEDAMTATLVNGHVLEQEDPFFTTEDLIVDDAINGTKEIIGFLLGAVYRQDEDPTDLTLMGKSVWEVSETRRHIERVLSGGAQTLLRHRVLNPMTLEEAMVSGLVGLCDMHFHIHDGDSKVDADFLQDGSVSLSVRSETLCTEFIIGPQTLPITQIQKLLMLISNARSHRPFQYQCEAQHLLDHGFFH